MLKPLLACTDNWMLAASCGIHSFRSHALSFREYCALLGGVAQWAKCWLVARFRSEGFVSGHRVSDAINGVYCRTALASEASHRDPQRLKPVSNFTPMRQCLKACPDTNLFLGRTTIRRTTINLNRTTAKLTKELQLTAEAMVGLEARPFLTWLRGLRL
jgi:hypothetical protein